jgi:acetolactate synthase-1/2/3 large subunit
MRVTGAQIVVHLLEKLGVVTVAGIPGGAILPLYDALAESSIRHVLARHEQGAGFIAQGIARATGRAGVCLATSGPGATNLVTALADAKADSIPLVALTANVTRSLMGTDAFQEVDFYTLTISVTKHNFLVEDAGDLFRVIPEAFRLAESPRPGPVSVDIPKDVLGETVELEAWPEVLTLPVETNGVADPEDDWIEMVAGTVASAERPVIYAGGGAAGSWEALRAFARTERIPVATTLMGLGLMEPADPLWLGMVGMHGTQRANQALADADLVLALGVRFDDRATGKISEFCPKAVVVHVDLDRAELGKIHRVDYGWAGDVGRFLEALGGRSPLRAVRCAEFDPAPIFSALAEALGPDALVTTDVGQHQMWAAQHFPVRKPGTFLTSGGLGTMGFGLPAAIGAALARPGQRVACLTGDGSILMNIQELATLAELRLPVVVVVFHNGGLGMVRQQQELFYESQFVASGLEGGPDFPALARAFGLKAWKVSGLIMARRIFAEALSYRGPSLIEIPVAQRALVFPMVAPGSANTDALTARPMKEASGGTL